MNMEPHIRVTNTIFRNNSVETVPVATIQEFDVSDSNNDNNNDNNNNNNNNRPPPPKKSASEGFDARGQIFRDLEFVGRGGGMALIINAVSPAVVVISEIEFRENTALEYGGGLYVLLQGRTSHSVSITNCRFVANVSPSSSGGLHVTFLSEGVESESNRVLVSDTLFERNTAIYGGGVFLLPLTLDLALPMGIGIFGRFERCTFVSNRAEEVGGALGIAYTRNGEQQLIKPMEINDCVFRANEVDGAGIVSIANFPVIFSGKNLFTQNRGPSLAIIGALVNVYGSLDLHNNSNNRSFDGGALYVTSQGQIQLNPGTRMILGDNYGVYGAAIVIRNLQLSPSISRLMNNPLCSFLFRERTLPPDQWRDHNVSILIVANSALISSGVYTNNINLCSWRNYSIPYFSHTDAFRWSFVTYRNNRNLAQLDPRDETFSVQTPPIRMEIRPKETVAFPGEIVPMEISAFDEFDGRTSAVVSFFDDSSSSQTGKAENLELYRFPSSISLNNLRPKFNVSVDYSVNMERENSPREEITARTVGGVDSILSASGAFNLTSLACPTGNILQPLESSANFSKCSCNNGRKDIVACEGAALIKDDLLWGYSQNYINKDEITSIVGAVFTQITNNSFFTYPCPSRYCGCTVTNLSGIRKCAFMYDENYPDLQCRCNRTGLLCGDCPDGHGTSALLNNCVSCDDRYTLLIMALIIVDIAIVTLMLILMLPLPSWLYPTLGYLQILPHLTEHFPVTFEKLSPYLYYITSAVGLYFPYDFCFHSNMGAAPVYALRYIPVIVTIIIAPIILYIRLKKFRPCDWHGVWLLVLLLYTPLIHTSMSLLNCPTLQGESSFTPRWYINGNIECFRDPSHIPLGIFALIVLACCVGLVPIVVLVATKKLTKPYWVHRLVAPITDPYKDGYAWWCGVELGKRIVLVLFTVAFNKNDYAVIFSLVVILALDGFIKPYKSTLVNVLDVVYLVNIFFLLCFRNTVDLEDVLHIPPEDQMIGSNVTDDGDGCTDIQGYSTFVGILSAIFYFPVLLALGVASVWAGHLLWGYVWNDCMPLMKTVDNKEEKSDNINLTSSLAMEHRARTQTVIELSNCEDSSPNLNNRKFSFRVQTSFNRFTSKKRKKKGKFIGQKSSDIEEFEEFELQTLPQSSGVKKKSIPNSEIEGKPLSSLIVSTEMDADSCHSTESTSEV